MKNTLKISKFCQFFKRRVELLMFRDETNAWKKVHCALSKVFLESFYEGYLWILVSMLTNLAGQNISVNVPDDMGLAGAASARVCVLAFVESWSSTNGTSYWIASIGHSSGTPADITSWHVTRARGQQTRRLLQFSNERMALLSIHWPFSNEIGIF